MKLKSYIKNELGITITEAARQLSVSRQYLTDVCNGKEAGKSLSFRVEDWSGGKVSALTLMRK